MPIPLIEAAANDVRDKFRQESCEKFGMRKQTSWTPRSSRELAQKTGLEYLHFEAFELPSKFIHPTYFGTYHVSRESPGPRHNTLKATHALAIETILAHRRFFKSDPLASPQDMNRNSLVLAVCLLALTALPPVTAADQQHAASGSKGLVVSGSVAGNWPS